MSKVPSGETPCPLAEQRAAGEPGVACTTHFPLMFHYTTNKHHKISTQQRQQQR